MDTHRPITGADWKELRAMVTAPLPVGVPSFSTEEAAEAWVRRITDHGVTRIAQADDEVAMRGYYEQRQRRPGTDRQCIVDGVPYWVGAGSSTEDGQ